MSRIFSGIGDHLDAAYTMAALGFTVSAWVKQSASSSVQIIADIYSDATHVYSSRINAANNINAQHIDPTASGASDSTAGITSDGAWHVGIWSFVGLSSRAAFIDGINKGTNSATRTLLTPTTLVVGQNSAGANRFLGKMAHLAIWGGVPTDADIATLANVSPNMVRPDILLDYWPLQSNNASEPSYGSRGTILTVTGTTFSTDDPVVNASIIQPMYYNRKQMFFV